ncbi:hypothetical protein MishRS11D_17360 [Methylomagnum ishizawai]|nr:hypothetical protein MishRS11D_17360 [Methylomagnum ishizawai]
MEKGDGIDTIAKDCIKNKALLQPRRYGWGAAPGGPIGPARRLGRAGTAHGFPVHRE